MTTPSTATQPATALHPRIRELIDYLEVHRRQLHDAVASVPEKLREIRPADNAWSVAEVMEHVSLIEQRIAMLVTKHAGAARAGGVGPDPETSSVVASYVNPARVVDRTDKIVAPQPVQPGGALDSAAGTRALEASHAALVSSLRAANGVSLTNSMQTHPVLGPLNIYHWIVATALHDDRHAAQIREIGTTLGGG
jgi:hypothetical protein